MLSFDNELRTYDMTHVSRNNTKPKRKTQETKRGPGKGEERERERESEEGGGYTAAQKSDDGQLRLSMFSWQRDLIVNLWHDGVSWSVDRTLMPPSNLCLA